MSHEEIVARLSNLIMQGVATPSEIVFAITMEAILQAIVHRMGENALSLTVTDLLSARDEVKIALDHCLDERDYIQMGLDVWEAERDLT
ncbi:hypothetical protein KP003_02930 [Geomonas nitrogeniifigens]|uniref:hypothetical protein n=1 Tax=Geomonas diazotrophica TaxID=2843197 RepID=UPI001C2C0241|nr:hypothetical protein [Geomonas nitrogeniifigens]QXE87379.1 hypothetical protein KP003_02930 [Geomonas nitrogeniifigens]